ncbi:MAG TPA: flagellar hook-length control protein FliK [Xanthobacteraceae bacterium]|nr:flagellar hook-length control protein FliK [Xanthobacteraceae bacterium]
MAADAQTADSTATPGSTKKSKESNSDQGNGDAADTAATAANSSSGTAANAPTPVATIIVANSAIDSTPGATANASANIAIGAQAKARALTAAARTGSHDSDAPQSADGTATTGTTAADATAANNAANAASNPSSARSPTASDAGAQAPANLQQMLNQTDGNATQADTSGQAGTTAITTHGGGASTTGSTDSAGSASQAAGAAAKAVTGNVPTFGVVAANVAATSQTVAPAANAATTPTVSLAGLPVAIASRAQAGSSQFDIRLDPPELGRIEVQLSVDGNGQVTSHITADRQDTLNLLQNQQPQLQQALEQAGLKTSDSGMQFSLRDQSFAGQQQQNQNFGQNGNGAQANTQQVVVPDSSLSAVDTTQIYSRLNLRSGLDIRV